jgi:starch-binding outer membrane protein, SusD/RagB family
MRILNGVLVAAVVLLAGCVDLDVINPNEPDRERVLATPGDVQSLISTSFQLYFDNAQQTNPNIPNAAMADNITGGFFDFGVFDMTEEPRVTFDASPLNTRGFVGRAPWSRLYPVLSNVNDGLFAIDQGLRITTGPAGADETPRALAFGKFVQGITLGYLALYYDQAIIVTEDTDIEQMDPRAFVPYPEVQAEALKILDEAIAIAQANTFLIPGSVDWVNGVPLSNADLVRLINTYKARLLAYMPRGWDDRMAVDWAEVLRLIDAGITEDFAPEGQLLVWEGNYRRLLARVRTLRSDHVRPDYRALGPADVSGRFQTWISTPSEDRTPFQIVSPDRRIHGAAGPTAEGKYFGYAANNIWPAGRGTYRWSHYYWHREGLGDSWHVGRQVVIARTEMDLLKAEALIRLNRAAEAVPLVNLTRVAAGELPPVTLDGPPLGDDRVPRKHDGACGSLWDALIHERQLELMGREGSVMWWDFRGLNRLQEGTLVHFPVSGIEMENLGLRVYTFGGVGGDGAAPAPQYGRCPAALPRC